ncbi:MAG: single-stranded DNA-binding protein [Acidobacteriota bacterium]|jgi:single-strand DNA-binding protein
MSSLNKVLLIGRLGKDPDIRYTPDGSPVASFSLATSENWTDKSGTRQERTEWHNIVAWNKLADICKQFLSKGRQVYIEGRIQTREYTDREGAKRRITEIIASQMVMLGSRPQGAEAGVQPMEPVARPATDADQAFGDSGITDSDIPF